MDDKTDGEDGSEVESELSARSRKGKPRKRNLAYWLVVTMLFVLLPLLLIVMLAPLIIGSDKEVLEYYKWAGSILIGAFGAWIGAGAAHFFGRENLKESSRSTEEALKIQNQGQAVHSRRGPEKIGDLSLTAINSDFVFSPGSKKEQVVDKLKAHPSYWFLPELRENGSLQDVLHSRLLWAADFQPTDTLDQIVTRIDSDDAFQDLRSFHGAAFFAPVKPDQMISEVSNQMDQKKIEVGIVVDPGGRPTHCFTQTELKTYLNAQH